MLTQNRNFPQALIGESVEIIWSVLPPRPALRPACLDQFICQRERGRERGQSGEPNQQTSSSLRKRQLYLGAQVFLQVETVVVPERRRGQVETASWLPPLSPIPGCHLTSQLHVTMTSTCLDRKKHCNFQSKTCTVLLPDKVLMCADLPAFKSP